MNLAIIIGVSQYDNGNPLEACDNDIDIMKNISEKLNKFDDICYISNSPKAYEAKQIITKFINKHKEQTIDELVFYFSGHGARYPDDFFYVFKDFSEAKKETTGLRNTELDGLIKNLSPKLTIKIIDACFSGTTYIKSNQDSIQPIFQKSADQNKLNNLYFFYSSSSEEESIANKDYSFFSKSFFKSLTQNTGKMRYRDIMAYVADDMNSNSYPEPMFIVQANNTEIFGEINTELIDYINSKFPPNVHTISNSNVDDIEKNKNLFQLIKTKSEEEYCTQDEGIENIKLLNEMFKSDKWTNDITDIFEIEITELDYNIPNTNDIARWLNKNTDENYFVKPIYEDETYYQEEYIEIPTKPNNSYAQIIRMSSLFDNKKDYKLEKIEKTRKILNGIEFTTVTAFKAMQIKFKPKFNAIENYALTIVPIFSRKNLVIFNSIEILEYNGWNSINHPKCHEWNKIKLLLKNKDGISTFCKNKCTETTTYIIEDIKSKLSS